MIFEVLEDIKKDFRYEFKTPTFTSFKMQKPLREIWDESRKNRQSNEQEIKLINAIRKMLMEGMKKKPFSNVIGGTIDVSTDDDAVIDYNFVIMHFKLSEKLDVKIDLGRPFSRLGERQITVEVTY